MIKYNLHTHSFYCGHGSGEICEYSGYANEKGFKMLGFSEHCPFPDDFYHSTRMAYSQMSSYERDVIQAKNTSSMDIFLGYECDYFPKWDEYFKELREHVDYLISGTHLIIRPDGSKVSPFTSKFKKEDVSLYAKSYIKAMETGLFLFMAHPDVFLLYYPWDEEAKAASRDIISASIDLDIPLEVNANGIMKSEQLGLESWGYPNSGFWSLAALAGVKAVCSSDAHKVENLDKNYDKVFSFISSIGVDILEPVVEDGKIKFKSQDLR